MSQIGYVDAREPDMRFIRHSWVESFRTSHYAGIIPMEDYFRTYHRIVRKLMERDGVHAKVAINPKHSSQIYGFCCYEEGFSLPLLHYCYVKEDFRQLPSKDESFTSGIATLLLKECGVDPEKPFYYTFKTGAWARLVKWEGPFANGIFRPLFARFDKEEAVTHERGRVTKYKKHLPQEEKTQCA